MTLTSPREVIPLRRMRPAPLIASSSVHDIEGEGEEDEETKHEVRTKVYRMMTKQDESQQWTDVGIGAYLEGL